MREEDKYLRWLFFMWSDTRTLYVDHFDSPLNRDYPVTDSHPLFSTISPN